MVIFIDSIGLSMVYSLLAPLFGSSSNGILPGSISPSTRHLLYGFCMGIYPVMMFFGSPIFGSLSDQLGRKKILLFCLYGEAIGMGLSALSINVGSVPLLMVGRAFSGLMAASLPIAQATILDISAPKNKIINIGVITFSNTLGFVVGPLIGGYLADKHLVPWFSLSTPFYFTALMALLSAVILMVALKEKVVCKTFKVVRMLRGMTSLFSILRNPAIRNISIIYFFSVLGWLTYIQFISFYLAAIHQYSPTQLGHFISWIALMMSVSMLLIVRLLIKIFRPHQIFFVALVMAILGIIVAFNQTIPSLWVGAILIAFGVGLSYSAVLTLYSDFTDSTQQGQVMGVASSIAALAGGIAGLLNGVLLAVSYESSFMAIALVWSVALLLFIFRARFFEHH